jgi:phospholipid/cholesterol/gamma-HCH transport system substrate-binding protein
MKMHYSHGLAPSRLSQIIGAFILIPMLGLILLGLTMARSEHWFDSSFRLLTSLTQAYGLEPGAPVRVSGIAIGRVDAIELNGRGTVDVSFLVYDRYRELVRSDAVAKVGKSGLLVGQTEIEIVRGDPTKPAAVAGAQIKAEEPRDYAELLNDVKPVVESVQRTLARVEDLSKELQTTVQAGGRVLANVERATADLPEITASAKRTAGTIEKTAAELPAVTTAIRGTVQKVDAALVDVRAATKKLPAVLDTAQEAVVNVRAATASVKQMTSDLNRDVPALVHNGRAAVDDVNRILAGAKKTFPVSMMLKNAGTPPAPKSDVAMRSLRGDELGQ